MASFKEIFQESKLNGQLAKLKKGPGAEWKITKMAKKQVGELGHSLGEHGMLKTGWNATGGKVATIGKWGAIAAVAAGGLAYIASAGKRKVTPQSLENEPLDLEQMGDIAPVMDEEVALPPLQIDSSPTESMAQERYWQDYVAGKGPTGAEKLASTPTPSIAKDMGVDNIRTEKSDLSLGA